MGASLVISSKIMPGGWHYLQDGVSVTAPTYEGLTPALEHYRVQNRLPVGDVQGDIDRQICERFPRQCHRRGEVLASSTRVVRSSATPMSRLLDDIAAWARKLLSSREAFSTVDKNTAEKRARVCAQCPSHTRYSGCPECVANVEGRSAQLRSNQDVPTGRRLDGCMAWRFDCRAAVFIDRRSLPDKPARPPKNPGCWLLQEKKAVPQ